MTDIDRDSVDPTAKIFSGAKARQVLEDPKINLLRSEEHTSELQSQSNLVCRLLLEKKETSVVHSPCSNSFWCSRITLSSYRTIRCSSHADYNPMCRSLCCISMIRSIATSWSTRSFV